MTLTIKINLDNAAFKHDDGSLDYGTVSETVYIVSKWVESGEKSGSIGDGNGNTVGKFEIKESNHDLHL